MMTIANYGMYVERETIPEWIHAERYEYCDSFYEQRSHFGFKGLKQLFSILF